MSRGRFLRWSAVGRAPTMNGLVDRQLAVVSVLIEQAGAGVVERGVHDRRVARLFERQSRRNAVAELRGVGNRLEPSRHRCHSTAEPGTRSPATRNVIVRRREAPGETGKLHERAVGGKPPALPRSHRVSDVHVRTEGAVGSVLRAIRRMSERASAVGRAVDADALVAVVAGVEVGQALLNVPKP